MSVQTNADRLVVELVKTNAVDGLRLDGALHVPRQHLPRQPGGGRCVDAILCLSGVASNFYASTMLEDLLPSLLSLDAAVLWANTRGHDGLFAASTIKGAQRFGAAMEVVDHCRLDVTAWCDFLVQCGYARIGIFGHSLGAIKAIYSQALQAHANVARIVAASPPCLSFTRFGQGEQAELFAETIRTAEQLVAQGQPQQLMEVRFPFPLTISASGYLDKYGPQERYNLLRFAQRVACPLQFVFGSLELQGVAFAGLPESLAALPDEGQRFSYAIISEADHMYSGRRDALAQAVADWFAA